jgi:hypothetical protein
MTLVSEVLVLEEEGNWEWMLTRLEELVHTNFCRRRE